MIGGRRRREALARRTPTLEGTNVGRTRANQAHTACLSETTSRLARRLFPLTTEKREDDSETIINDSFNDELRSPEKIVVQLISSWDPLDRSSIAVNCSSSSFPQGQVPR